MMKFIILLVCLFLLSVPAFAKDKAVKLPPLLKLSISQYKAGNYVGAKDNLTQLILKEPKNPIVYYYLAISDVKLGQKDSAIEEYNNVITLAPNSKFSEYAQQGLKYLNATPGTPSGLTPGVGLPMPPSSPGQPMSKLNQLKPGDTYKLPDIKEIGKMPLKSEASEENPVSDAKNKAENSSKSQEDVAQALKVLAQYGYNQNANPEAAQMNMLMSSMGGGMNNNGSNSMMNMLPLMMSQQGSGANKNVDPAVMEGLINSMMMSGMSGMFSSGNNNNNY